MTYPAWSETEDAYVRQAIAAGRTHVDIARSLGRTPAAVKLRKHKLSAAA